MLAVGQNQWYHFGVGAPPVLVNFSGDWEVHWDPWPFGNPRVVLGHEQEVLRLEVAVSNVILVHVVDRTYWLPGSRHVAQCIKVTTFSNHSPLSGGSKRNHRKKNRGAQSGGSQNGVPLYPVSLQNVTFCQT